MRALYAGIFCASLGLASLLGGCGRGTVTVKIGNSEHRLYTDANKEFNRIIEFRDQHGYTQCRDQERLAILMAASAKDGDITNPICMEDLAAFSKQALQQNEAIYGGKLPGVKGSADKITVP